MEIKRRHHSSNNEEEEEEEEEERKFGSETIEVETDRRPKTGTLAVDRISSLPDSILLHILSLLPTTAEAIRTGTLSKRWQFLWNSVPNLSFHSRCPRSPSLFANLVTETLIQCRPHYNLRKFKLYFFHYDSFAFQLNQWILYAVSRNVEDLELIGGTWDDKAPNLFRVPEHLFTYSFLTNFVLEYCIFKPNGSISWKLLQRLSLSRAELSEAVIQNVMLGSPVLEVLELKFCYGFDRLSITSASLKKLILSGYGEREPLRLQSNVVLEISAPNILSLDIGGDLHVRKLVLLNMASLVEANLDFKVPVRSRFVPDKQMWRGLLQSLQNVNELKVGSLCVEVLSYLELEDWTSPMSKRKRLNMGFIRRSCFPGLVNLLESSPYLESLLIFVEHPLKPMVYGGIQTRGNYSTYQTRSFKCLQQHLKTVKISYFVEWDGQCELVRFLLENACMLETMIIYVESVHSKQSSSVSQGLLMQETQKLLSFPRASRNAEVLFEWLK